MGPSFARNAKPCMKAKESSAEVLGLAPLSLVFGIALYTTSYKMFQALPDAHLILNPDSVRGSIFQYANQQLPR